MEKERTVTVVLRCRVHHDETCEGEVTRTLHIPEGTPLPTEYQCVRCAGKLDKLGRFRKARPRKSLTLDHPEYRTDKYRATRKPEGMTETKIKGPIQSQVASYREGVRWAEAHILEFLTREGFVTARDEISLLRMYQSGKSYQEIAECLGYTKSNVPLKIGRVVGSIGRRLKAIPLDERSPELRFVFNAIMNGDSESVVSDRAQIEGSEFTGETYIPTAGPESPGIEAPEEAYARRAPIERIAMMNGDDLDGEAMDYVIGLDREGAERRQERDGS